MISLFPIKFVWEFNGDISKRPKLSQYPIYHYIQYYYIQYILYADKPVLNRRAKNEVSDLNLGGSQIVRSVNYHTILS